MIRTDTTTTGCQEWPSDVHFRGCQVRREHRVRTVPYIRHLTHSVALLYKGASGTGTGALVVPTANWRTSTLLVTHTLLLELSRLRRLNYTNGDQMFNVQPIHAGSRAVLKECHLSGLPRTRRSVLVPRTSDADWRPAFLNSFNLRREACTNIVFFNCSK